MGDVNFKILDTLIEFPPEDGGWRKELNLVSWYGKTAKYDLRSWNEDHSRNGKGLTLTKEELLLLKEKLGGIGL